MAACKKSKKQKNYTFQAFSYERLSKEDGDKAESNSIANQRKLIQEYVRKQEDIVLVGDFFDDGFTGTNFERPQFEKMMDAVQRGEADCIIVKDLSRFGRDYIDSGKYIQKTFPMLGIRFIAINDNIDSAREDQADDLIIPFKNLINDSYCRDLSIKLRGQFRVQRLNGEFIGSHVAYGYLKSEQDKHKLVVDEEAAETVRMIFAMKLQGHSQKQIADYLNAIGVLAPAEYKRQRGMNYRSGFQLKARSVWTPVTVKRILQNRIYIGCLEQGKRSTPNYKVKKMHEKNPEEWIVVEDNHEPIIEKLIFDAVERSMERDTKISEKGTVYPLSGFLYCGDCENQMVTRTVTRGKQKFCYYVCGTNKYGKGCTSHSFSARKLEQNVLQAINLHMDLIFDIQNSLNQLGEERLKSHRMMRVNRQIEDKQKEIEENREYRLRLYESMVGGVIVSEEYAKLRQRYTQRIEEGEEQVTQLKEELRMIEAGISETGSWIDSFLKYREVTNLTRDLVLTVIDKIYVYEGKTISIQFNFQDEFGFLKEFVERTVKEVG